MGLFSSRMKVCRNLLVLTMTQWSLIMRFSCRQAKCRQTHLEHNWRVSTPTMALPLPLNAGTNTCNQIEFATPSSVSPAQNYWKTSKASPPTLVSKASSLFSKKAPSQRKTRTLPKRSQTLTRAIALSSATRLSTPGSNHGFSISQSC